MTKRTYTFKEKATRKRQKRKNRTYSARFEPAGIGQYPSDRSIHEIVSDLHHEGHYGGLSENHQPNMLFEANRTLNDVPLGIVSHKQEPLPPRLLPNEEPELVAFCKRLISAVADEHLEALVVKGWPGGELVGLKSHVGDLLEVLQRDVETYRYLVAGQHYSARRRALEGCRPPDWSQKRFDAVLARMALLWCAHDVQLTFARGVRLEKNPFGTVAAPLLPSGRRNFLDSSYRVISPAAVVQAARPNYALAKRMVAMRDKPEKDQNKFLRNRAKGSRSFRRLHNAARAAYLEGANPALPLIVKKDMDAVEEAMAAEEQSNPFWQHLANHASAPSLPGTFAQLCLTGLTVLTSNAVSILRYCQAEQEIEELIARTDNGAGGCRALDGSLRAFSSGTLSPAMMKRARNLLRAYRNLYRDKDFANFSKGALNPTYPGEVQPLRDIGQGALDAAADFLIRCGVRRPEDHEGPIDSERRTFYLLDVIPDIRLTR